MGIFDFFKSPGLPNLPTAIVTDMNTLRELDSKMADQAHKYIATGEGGTVLSTLEVKVTSNLLLVGIMHYFSINQQDGRSHLMGNIFSIPRDVLVRYLEVLSACNSKMDSLYGTNHIAILPRILLGELLSSSEVHRVNDSGKKVAAAITPDYLLKAAALVGGTPRDVFDAIYTQPSASYYNTGTLYRSHHSLKAIVEANSNDFIIGTSRCDTAAISQAIDDLRFWKISRNDAFSAFILDNLKSSSKVIRQAAANAAADLPAQTVRDAAAAALKTGGADQRVTFVEVLARQDTPEARAILEAHQSTEKTARVKILISNALLVAQTGPSATTLDATKSDATETRLEASDKLTAGYTAVDGRWIDIPALAPLATTPELVITPQDRVEFDDLISAYNVAVEADNAASQALHKAKGFRNRHHNMPTISKQDTDNMFAVLMGLNKNPKINARFNMLTTPHGYLGDKGRIWLEGIFERLPPKAVLSLALHGRESRVTTLLDAWGEFGASPHETWLFGPDCDLRHLEPLAKEIGVSGEAIYVRGTRTVQSGDILRSELAKQNSYSMTLFDDLSDDAVWPYMAENLSVIDEAFNEASLNGARDKSRAIGMLERLPALPQLLMPYVLGIATGTGKSGKAQARKLLSEVPKLDEHLIGLLDDSRQDTRAGAAQWLSERGGDGALAGIRKRLKVEKSEIARAAFLQALKKLGDPLDDLLGPKALEAAAEAALKPGKLKGPHWLKLEALPKVHYHDGSLVSSDVIFWWICLAYKMKDPGAGALFGVYLDQLEPADAQAFSAAILDAWLGWDVFGPSLDEANAYAVAGAQSYFNANKGWMKDYSLERATSDLRRAKLNQLPNSAADAKGVLALACRIRPADAAARVQVFLKKHGSRTSQAISLLEMLASTNQPVAMQVVIASSLRLKQKGVQKRAGEIVERFAADRGWSVEELADRTVPTGGFDDDGQMELMCGSDEKIYLARLSQALQIKLTNPAGKDVSALPAGDDEHSQLSKKQLSTSKKEVKQVVTLQTARLYEAMCCSRSWPVDDWQRYFASHPIMGRLVGSLVWEGLDDAQTPQGLFRPTPEGDYTNVDDDPVDITLYDHIRIAHGATLDPASNSAWQTHLKDYEIATLFAQFGRPTLVLSADQASATQINDREGWLSDTFTLRGAATKLGWEREATGDGGSFGGYVKDFGASHITAVISFTGSYLPEENIPAALTTLHFEQRSQRGGYGNNSLALKDVPLVLLSECWFDYHSFVAKAAFDADWKTKGLWQ